MQQMDEYRQAQKEKWEREKKQPSPSAPPHSSSRTSSKPSTPEKTHTRPPSSSSSSSSSSTRVKSPKHSSSASASASDKSSTKSQRPPSSSSSSSTTSAPRAKSPKTNPATPGKHTGSTSSKKDHHPDTSPRTPSHPTSSPSATSTKKDTGTIQAGADLIRDTVREWKTSYMYSVHHIATMDNAEKYLTIWSKPTPTTPVPDHTANIYFTISSSSSSASTTHNIPPISYTIESNTYVHVPDKEGGGGIPFREEWLDRVIEGKRVAQEVLHR